MTLPESLRAALREIGVIEAPTTQQKPQKAPTAPAQPAWRPSYPGEEPPF